MGRLPRIKRRMLCAGLGFVLASLAVTTAAGASPGARASIVGGTTALSEEWPWAAFILAADAKGEGFSCSGTVISPDLILTAGHCVEDIETGKKTANAALEGYEKTVASYVDFRQQVAEATQLDWLSTVVKAQNDFITEATAAYTSAVRDVLK